MAKWEVNAKGIEEIVTYTRDEDTLITTQWWRSAKWEVITNDDNPPDINCDTNISGAPFNTNLLAVGEFRGGMDFSCTCDLSKDEDGSLNMDELYQPEDFGWVIDKYELWIRTDDIDILTLN